MAVLITARHGFEPAIIAFVTTICFSLAIQGCKFVEPIFAPANYEVKAEGCSTIKVRLIGGEGVSRLRQRDIIHDFMLDLSRDPTRESAAFDAMLELEGLFEHNGFPLAHIDRHLEQGEGHALITFDIDQGPRVAIKKLRINGNTFADETVLLGYWSKVQSEIFGLGEDLYVAANLATLGDSITGHYRRLGFLEAHVIIGQPKPPLQPGVNRVEVTVQVSEGPRYVTEAVQIDAELATNLTPNAPLPPQPGSPYVAAEIQGYGFLVYHFLRKHGHADPEIRTTTTPNADAHTVAITLHGDAGPIVKIKRVDIRGHSFAPEHTIRERIDMPVGSLFDGDKEDASLFRLYQSGLFRKIEVRHESAGEDQIVVTFEFEESTRYLLEPMIGYGSYEEFRAGLEFDMLNAFGSDFSLNAKGTASTKGHRIVTSLSDSQFMPWLFGYDTTLSIAADTFRRREPTFTDTAIGLSPALSHSFTPRLSSRIAYIFREHRDITSTVIDPGAQLDDYTESSALIELAYDSRDNPLIPKEGTRLAAQVKHYGDSLGGDVRFDRVRISASTVLPLVESTRLVLNAEAAWLFPEGSRSIIPIQERLFNGGENTVRSFREDKLAPANLLDINGQVIGGEYRNIFNVEVHWSPPLQFTRSVELELALFGDAGNLGESANNYGLTDMKYAIGTGLRFLLPIGPVRLDIARNPDREARERAWTAHFSIGYPF